MTPKLFCVFLKQFTFTCNYPRTFSGCHYVGEEEEGYGESGNLKL